MALVQTWTLQGGTPTTLGATDYLAFSSGTFGNAIAVGSYQGGTHVRSSGGSDSSSGNTPKNVKYVASGTCDKGGGTINVNTLATTDSTLKVNITYDTAITLSAVTIYAYDGTTDATAPTGQTYQMLQTAVDTAWTSPQGSGSAMALDGATFLNSATSHDAYVSVSMTPSAVGTVSTNKIKISFTYQ